MEPWTESERSIFGPYDRGDGKQVFADPLRIDRHLKACFAGDLDGVIEQARAGITENADGTETVDPTLEPVRFEAMNRLLAAVMKVFGLIAFDPLTGKGTTEDQCMAVYNAYVDFEQKKSPSTVTPPTTPPPTPATSDASTLDLYLMKSTTGSPSIENDNPYGGR